MPIVGGVAYVHSQYAQMTPTDASRGTHRVHGGGFTGVAVQRDELLAALRLVRSCFRMVGPATDDPEGAPPACSASARAAAQRRSPLTAALFAALAL